MGELSKGSLVPKIKLPAYVLTPKIQGLTCEQGLEPFPITSMAFVSTALLPKLSLKLPECYAYIFETIERNPSIARDSSPTIVQNPKTR